MVFRKHIFAAVTVIIGISVIVGYGIHQSIVRSNQLILQGEVDTKSVDLASKITGRVKQIHVKEGDIVKAGQILITLDTPDISAKNDQAKAAVEIARARKLKVDNGSRSENIKIKRETLNQAETNLDFAKKNYDRINKLRIQNCISQKQYEEAENAYRNAIKQKEIAQESLSLEEEGERFEEKLLADASLKQAENTQKETQSYLDESAIRSPMSGQVKEIIVDEGELVSAGYTLITIVDSEDNWVVLNLREDLVSKIKIGSEFNVKIPAVCGDKPIRVKVFYISAMGNYATWRATKIRGDFDLKTFEIHARPIEKVDGMIAGMSAIVNWDEKEIKR